MNSFAAGVLWCLIAATGNVTMASTASAAHLRVSDSVGDLLEHPAFAGFARLLLPWDDRRYDTTMTLSNIGSLLPYHTHVDPAVVVSPDEVTPAMVSAARLVHVDAVDEELSMRAARLARDAGVTVTSDIDTVTGRTRDLLAAVTVPIVAEQVATELTGESGLERALRRLRRDHAGPLCVTRGERGAVLLAGDTFYEQPAFRVQAVDTTGAGDVFRAGFIYALLRGDPPAALLRFAAAAGALSCTREGALGSGPTLEEVETLLRQVS